MPRPRGIPSYRLHRKSGQAVVALTDPFGNRKDILLGKHGSRASRLEYARNESICSRQRTTKLTAAPPSSRRADCPRTASSPARARSTATDVPSA